MRPSKNLENKTPLDTEWRVQLVRVKVQAHNSLELPLEHNQDISFDESSFFMALSIILGVTETLWCFRLVLDVKTGREIHDSSRLKFFKKFLENSFAVSDAENNTSRLLNRGGIADLTFLRTLLAVCQKSWEPSFC